MDFHHVLASRSIAAMTDLTAFSALPGAPVVPDIPSRRDRMVAAWRRRRTAVRAPQALRPALVTARRADARAAVPCEAAEGCRMVA